VFNLSHQALFVFGGEGKGGVREIVIDVRRWSNAVEGRMS